MSQYYFKNKDRIIAIVDYIPEANAFINIIEWLDIEAAPISIIIAEAQKHQSAVQALNEWYKTHTIPTYRDDLDSLKIKLNIKSVYDLKDNSYALSLSDQYWLHPVSSELTWDAVNFFTNDFEYLDFVDAVFSSSSRRHRTMSASPNYATDGMVKKAWIIDDFGNRTLLKGGYRKSRQEPFNELLASMLCENLKFDQVPIT